MKLSSRGSTRLAAFCALIAGLTALPLLCAGQTPSPAGQSASAAPALALSASFADGGAIRSGLVWRIFAAQADSNGKRRLVAQSALPSPVLSLAPGDYVAHVAYGLAGIAQSVSVPTQGTASVRLSLKAGALRVTGMLGAQAIPPSCLSLDIYVPQPGNSEAKLVVKGAKPGQVIGLPEGRYHVVSTYLDTVGVGSLNAVPGGLTTNSIVSADLQVETGKLTDATLRHRVALITLKLVNNAAGDALAGANFTVLTPGGDVIRELVGAFPSLVLAEGEYVVIARRDGKTFQTTFKVKSGENRDIAILAH